MKPSEAENDVIQKIKGKVGKPVKFAYPGEEGNMKGFLKDRSILASDPNIAGVPYWDVVDLIEFPDTAEPRWLRIGYYRKKQKEALRWGSQTTITEPLGIWKKLLVKAAKEKEWFRTLLKEVMAEVEG